MKNLTNYEIYEIMEIAHEISTVGFNEGWNHAMYCISEIEDNSEEKRDKAKERGKELMHKLRLLLMNM